MYTQYHVKSCLNTALSSFVKIQSDYRSPEIYRPENVTYYDMYHR